MEVRANVSSEYLGPAGGEAGWIAIAKVRSRWWTSIGLLSSVGDQRRWPGEGQMMNEFNLVEVCVRCWRWCCERMECVAHRRKIIRETIERQGMALREGYYHNTI
jgi:hypothetical protein